MDINSLLYLEQKNNMISKDLQDKFDKATAVCFDCWYEYGRHDAGVCSVYLWECGMCGKEKQCTEPRDFGYARNCNIMKEDLNILTRVLNNYYDSWGGMMVSNKLSDFEKWCWVEIE